MYYTQADEQILIDYLLPINQTERYYTLYVYPILLKLTTKILYAKKYSNIWDRESLLYFIISELYRKETLFKFEEYKNDKKHKMYSFLTTCITNEILMSIKKQFNDFNNQLKFYDAYKTNCGKYNYEDDYLITKENDEDIKIKAIDDAVWSLQQHEIIIYKMCFIDNLTIKQISEQTNISTVYIGQYIKDIRMKIREKLNIVGELKRLGKGSKR